MQFDISEEIEILARLHAEHGDDQITGSSIEGACWALSRVTRIEATDLLREVKALSEQFAPRERLVSPLLRQPTRPQTPAAFDEIPDLGYYPMLGKITKLGKEPPEADMARDPAAPSSGSFAAQFDTAMAEGGNEALAPMDPVMLAEVEAQMRAASGPR